MVYLAVHQIRCAPPVPEKSSVRWHTLCLRPSILCLVLGLISLVGSLVTSVLALHPVRQLCVLVSCLVGKL